MKSESIQNIENLGNHDSLTVQKSKPLFALWKSELTLSEFKILDTYLGRINSTDDNHRKVIFQKGELENLFGVKQMRPESLDNRLKHLMTSVVIPDTKNQKGFVRITLFEKASAELDEYGLWKVELTCTESAKKYIFNIEEINYLRYKLKNIINLKSRYSYILFLYLLENRYRKEWDISINDLKKLLNCDQEESYKQFKRFNDLILKKICKEITNVTDIKFKYSFKRTGRIITDIHFVYITDSLLKGQQLTFDQLECIETDAEEIDNDDPNLWKLALKPLQFSGEQLDEIFSILVTIPRNKMPQIDFIDDTDILRYHYLDQKVKEILRRDKQKEIRNKFSYLIAILKKDSSEDL